MNSIEFEIYVSALSFHTFSILEQEKVFLKHTNCHSFSSFILLTFSLFTLRKASPALPIISPWEQHGGIFGGTVITFKY